MQYRVVSFLFAAMIWSSAFACDVVVSPANNLAQVVSGNPGKNICLNEGTYNLNATLDLANGTSIEGLSGSRDNVIIKSTASRAIVAGSNVTLKNFSLDGPGRLSEFGILTADTTGVLIWGLRVADYKISIGVVRATSVNIWDTFVSLNGDTTNGIADPNFWITNSNGVTILWGEVKGRGNGPGGDGEIAAYDSTRVEITGTSVIDSGASAIYLVNCDYCKVSNATIHRAGEWGLDVVQGSDFFEASNNNIFWSNFGGSVFDEAGSSGGTYTGNTFQQNLRLGAGKCNGINVMGNIAGVSIANNVSIPARGTSSSVICKYK